MRSSDSIADLAAALVGAQADMPNVPKETMGQVGNAKRRYADLATVTETVRPILAKHHLAYVQGCSDGVNGIVTVTTRLMHQSGEWIEDSLSMPSGEGAQAVGSAITYGRRYSLMAVLGLAPDDDDGEAATQAATAAPPADRPTPRGGKSVTDKQLQLLAIRLRANGYDKAAGHKFATDIIGREIGSAKDMTAAEASKVIDALPADREQPTLDDPPDDTEAEAGA